MTSVEKNIFSNEAIKKCFIMGTGPSLSDTPLHLLKDHVTIGVNLILHSGFVPDYLCVSDREMAVDNFDAIFNEKMDDGTYVIARTKNQNVNNLLMRKNNVYLIEGFKEDKPIRPPHIDDQFLKFAMTKNGVINDLAVPLAVYLGFKEIYLLGVDGEHGPEAHFYDHAGTKNRKESIIRGPREPTKYDLLIGILNKKKIKLYNCSVNGNRTPEIGSMNLDEVLNAF